MRSMIVACFCMLQLLSVTAQHHKYVAPADPLVLKSISNWQDMKFGLFMHWGTYSQWGIVESWSICPEDEGWTQRQWPLFKRLYMSM